MKKFLLAIFFISICLQTYSQTWRRSANWGNDFTAVHWNNEEVGFISGSNIILKSIDGGLSWVEQEAPARTRMLALDFFNLNIGMMAGEEGQIFITDNGGDDWRMEQLPTRERLKGIRYLSEQRIIIVGDNGSAFLSINGGNSWSSLSLPSQSDFNSLYFVDNLLGFISTSAAEVLKTTDGGQSWQVFNTGFETELQDVYFQDEETGFAVGTAGTIIKTIDGGSTWTFINSGMDADYTKIAFHRTNPDIGLFAGRNGALMRTTNGGLTVAAVASRTAQDINDIQFRHNTNMAFAVSNSGTLTSSTNTGASWSLRLTGNSRNFHATHFTSASHGYIVGENGLILSTSNGGNSLADRSRPLSLPFHSLYFTTNTLGYVGGNNGNILKTTNSGGGWTALNPGTTRHIFGLFFFNNNQGYAVGSRGYLAKTENGGINWETIDAGTKDFNYTDIKFFNATTGLIIGENGFLSRTEDGQNWAPVSIAASQNLKSIEILDEVTAVIVGLQGRLWKTADQGESWERISTQFDVDFNDAAFLDESVGFIAGAKGHILKTEDGGHTWDKIHTGTFQNFTGISFGDLNSGFAVGEAGTFFRYSCLVPQKPTVIFGEDNICVSQQAYSIQGSTEPNVTYEWRVDGGTILEGQGSTRIVVRWEGAGRHAVMVRGQNNCGNSATTALEVTVSSQPGRVSAIQGEGTVCINNIEFYQVDSLPGTEYFWETAGGVIREGQGSGRISVEWTHLNNQKLKVSPVNPCGSGNPVEKAINIITEPAQPAEIGGAKMSGLGMEEEYSINAITDMSYHWGISGGGRIVSGQGTSSIKVKWSEEGTHTISLIPTNSCGSGMERTLEVNVDFITSVEKPVSTEWKVYPNPSPGDIYIDFAGLGDVRKIEVFNSLGQTITQMSVDDPAKLLEIQQLPKGVHTLRIQTRTQDFIRKIIVK